ncbi:MAG: NIL domain-containing protein [Deltaproteobacteria bacterium]|nr:NIL domain-containing protein [Deltaproteobacteria bacterium]
MIQKSVILNFPRKLVDEPLVSRVIRDCDVEVNILQASVTPEEDGHMFVIFKGEPANIGRALDFLKERGVRAILPVKNLVRDEERCVHCGACVGQCASAAFTIDKDTCQVVFDPDRCIACELCIPACGYGAVESVSDHLKRTGEAS